jgi:MFS family permease
MSSAVELKTITTDIPARLDRLPWAKFHWMVIVGLGTVWILDGLEVTIVGSMSEALKSADTGLGMSNFDIGLAGAVYVAGGCLGALVFGQLTDRFGRKKLFLITLAVYTVATVLTAFAPNVLRTLHRPGVPGTSPFSRPATSSALCSSVTCSTRSAGFG